MPGAILLMPMITGMGTTARCLIQDSIVRMQEDMLDTTVRGGSVILS